MDQQRPSSALDLHVLAAQLRRLGEDLSLYAGFLMTMLSTALPADLVEVKRESRWRAGLSGREPAVLDVSVTVGNQRYGLSRESASAAPTAYLRHHSGGVVLSTQRLGLDEWSRRLADALAGLAEHDGAVAAVLQRLTVG